MPFSTEKTNTACSEDNVELALSGKAQHFDKYKTDRWLSSADSCQSK